MCYLSAVDLWRTNYHWPFVEAHNSTAQRNFIPSKLAVDLNFGFSVLFSCIVEQANGSIMLATGLVKCAGPTATSTVECSSTTMHMAAAP